MLKRYGMLAVIVMGTASAYSMQTSSKPQSLRGAKDRWAAPRLVYPEQQPSYAEIMMPGGQWWKDIDSRKRVETSSFVIYRTTPEPEISYSVLVETIRSAEGLRPLLRCPIVSLEKRNQIPMKRAFNLFYEIHRNKFDGCVKSSK